MAVDLDRMGGGSSWARLTVSLPGRGELALVFPMCPDLEREGGVVHDRLLGWSLGPPSPCGPLGRRIENVTFDVRRTMRMRGSVVGAWFGMLLVGSCAEEVTGDDPGIDDAPTIEIEQDDSSGVQSLDTDYGRWRKGRPLPELTAEQREEITRLEAIGYLSGTVAAGPLAGVTTHDEDRTQAGLNLIVSGHRPQADLMTMDGRTLHSWTMPYTEAFPEKKVSEQGARVRRNATEPGTNHHMWRRARLLPGGELLAIYEFNGLVRVDKDSSVIWAWDEQAHHDMDVDPRGHVHVLCRGAHLVPSFNEERPVLEDYLVVLNEKGREVRRISILECLENSEFAHHLDPMRERGGDILHTNTIQILDGRHAALSPVFAKGNLLISPRNLNLLAIVDPREKKVVWTRTGSWHRQHEPVLRDDGKMLLFDNGRAWRRRSAVLVIDPLSGEVEWSYQENEPDVFFSQFCGSVQPLANGNVLVTESIYGRAFEMTPDKKIVWEYHNPYRAGKKNELVATLFDVVRIDRADVQDWLPAE